MVRSVQVTVPHEHADSVANILKEFEHSFGVCVIPGVTSTLILFKIAEKRLEKVLRILLARGYGESIGTIDIIQLQSTKPNLSSYYGGKERKKKRQYVASDRMTVEEIYEIVDGPTHLTFDFLMNTFAASVIAAVGLSSDSSVTVVAAMLVSPLMGPILGVTFGYAINESSMVLRALRTELCGACIALTVGLLSGLCLAPFYGPGGISSDWASTDLDSFEMTSRGNPYAFIGGSFTAAPSGIGVALGICSGGVNALVGVAISAALLPPIVNAGMCVTFSAWYFFAEGHDRSDSIRFASMAACSFGLFLLNFLFIFTFARIIFHIKKIKPIQAGMLHTDDGKEKEEDGDGSNLSLDTLPREEVANANTLKETLL